MSDTRPVDVVVVGGGPAGLAAADAAAGAGKRVLLLDQGLQEKLAMSGYGFYVWSSFALALAVVLYNEWSARRRCRRVWRDVEVRIKAIEDQG